MSGDCLCSELTDGRQAITRGRRPPFFLTSDRHAVPLLVTRRGRIKAWMGREREAA